MKNRIIILLLVVFLLAGCSTKNRNDVKEYLNRMDVFAKNPNNSYQVSFKRSVHQSDDYEDGYDYVWPVSATIDHKKVKFYVIEHLHYEFISANHSLYDTYYYHMAKEILNNIDFKSFTLEEKIPDVYLIEDNTFLDTEMIHELNYAYCKEWSCFTLKSSFVSIKDYNKKLDELETIYEDDDINHIVFNIELYDENNIFDNSDRVVKFYIDSLDDIANHKKTILVDN